MKAFLRTAKYKGKTMTVILLLLFLFPIILGIFTPATAAAAEECPPGQIWDPGEDYGADVSRPGRAPGCVPNTAENKTVIATQEARPDTTVGPGECTRWWHPLTQPINCAFIPLASWSGALFMSFGAALLQASGAVFNTLVKWIVVEFGSTIQTLGLLDGIHQAWEILRDISNIVIIGMFVFIAISMILGNETFGAKKLVAHVLIIAVLINFSLLFSKLIIDAGNFTAYQFYKAMGGTADDEFDIAGRFYSVVGITSAWDSFAVAERFARGSQKAGTKPGESSTTGNNFAAGVSGFLYGIFGGMLLIASAIVLFYGSYLIIVRAVLLVFLMLVSALAFASWLVPKMNSGSISFSAWWKSLINASVFAPLLMIMLYVSLLIMNPAAGKREGSLGAIAGNPEKVGQNWKTLIIFIFGIGMLYVSFKVANTFSRQIAGFSVASGAVGKAFGATAGTAGLFGRYSLGLLGSQLAARTGLGTMDGLKGRIARAGLSSLATGSFDVRRIPGVASGAKYGVDFGKAKGEGGYLKAVSDREKRIIATEAGYRQMVTTKTNSDFKEERLLEEQKQAAAKRIREQEARAAELSKHPAVAGKPAEKAQPTPAPATQGAYGRTQTARDIADAQQRQAQTAAAGKEEGKISTDAETARIARIERGLRAEEKQSYLTEGQVRSAAQATLAAGVAPTDENRAVVEELRKVRESITAEKELLARLEKTPTSRDIRGQKFDDAMRNSFYFLDFSKHRTAARAEKIAETARKTDYQKLAERLAKDMEDVAKKEGKKTADVVKEAVEKAAGPAKEAGH
ncbi:MAG: Uncharacterized protein G01um10148_98 [Parcubacteria group bacterium Gr01-1014_8]|nr:MAG: Uncharacterized protein G01um10148_98 [Parcubacteria group bacterium Gr01-1014_8]